ncbi:MAG: hypothetical protein PHW04_16130 [Candidatus Wallbacteria bacterium]|nr:hypothetical protein [Candidatus Wallbacteria bacterium]
MLQKIKPQYVVNSAGKKVKVILEYKTYLEMLELIEDLSDARLIDETRNEPGITLEEYKRKRKIA